MTAGVITNKAIHVSRGLQRETSRLIYLSQIDQNLADQDRTVCKRLGVEEVLGISALGVRASAGELKA